MDYREFLSREYGIKPQTVEIMQKAEAALSGRFAEIDEMAAYHQARVLSAFRAHRVSEQHLGLTTGYGYDDVGRDTLDAVYAEVFGA